MSSYHNSLHANCSKPPKPISTMAYFFSIGSVSMTIINFLPEQHSLDNLTYNIKEKKTLKTCGNHSIMPKVSHSWSVVHQVRDLLPIQIFVEHGSSFFDVLSMFYFLFLLCYARRDNLWQSTYLPYKSNSCPLNKPDLEVNSKAKE